METYAWLVLLFPLAGCVTVGLLYNRLPGRTAGVIGTLAIAAAFVCSILALVELEGLGEEERQQVFVAWDYAKTTGVDAQLSILIDPLSLMMMVVVTGVSTLIHLYSTAYMASDRGYARFFAYLNFFVFSMLVLVMAGNIIVLLLRWAGGGGT